MESEQILLQPTWYRKDSTHCIFNHTRIIKYYDCAAVCANAHKRYHPKAVRSLWEVGA